MLASRRHYFTLCLTLLATEIAIALFVHDDFIRPFVGDFLVVILLYCMIRSFTKLTVETVAMAVLIFSFLIETLQYFQIVNLLGLQDVTPARIIIGTTFSWSDICAYALGILFVLFIETNLKSSRTWNIL
jgi:hypothetical protein